MFDWVTKTSDLYVKIVTVFEKLGALSKEVDGLAEDLHETSVRMGRVEGVTINVAELMRQIDKLHQRQAFLEAQVEVLRMQKSKPIQKISMRQPKLQKKLSPPTRP